MRDETVVTLMANQSFRVYVNCNRLNGSDRDSVRRLLEEHGVGIDSTHQFDGEVMYTSRELSDTPEHHDLVDRLEADIRDTVDEDDIKRDKKNMSPRAPGIEGVTYVTGIIIGVADD